MLPVPNAISATTPGTARMICSTQRAFLGFKNHREKERILANWNFRVRGNPCRKAQWQKGYFLGSPEILHLPVYTPEFPWPTMGCSEAEFTRASRGQQNSPLMLSSSSSTRSCNFSQFSLAFMPELREIPSKERSFF